MHPADIIACLTKVGHRPAKLARDLGVTGNAVSMVIHKRIASQKIANRISQVTGKSLEELWPGKYTNPRPRGRQRAA